MTIAEAMNTFNIALYSIKQKGYSISLDINSETDEIESWKALKNDNTISAFNPLSLLALVNICEEYGENWRQVNTGNLYDEILENDIL